jgi:hypothetical protein
MKVVRQTEHLKKLRWSFRKKRDRWTGQAVRRTTCSREVKGRISICLKRKENPYETE